MNHLDFEDGFWLNQPRSFEVKNDQLRLVTEPRTDMWQETYYHFRRANAPMFLFPLTLGSFSFCVKVTFSFTTLYDQCGLVLYDDEMNWMKACVEHFEDKGSCIGCCVSNHSHSDWSCSRPIRGMREAWFKLSRRGDDFRVEASEDGQDFHEIRVFHRYVQDRKVKVGLIACSPQDSSIHVQFYRPALGPCEWPKP